MGFFEVLAKRIIVIFDYSYFQALNKKDSKKPEIPEESKRSFSSRLKYKEADFVLPPPTEKTPERRWHGYI
jgi:hypothetical protein